jgi:hypothetical protein
MLPAQLASATNKDPKVLPPNSHAFGATYAEWNSRWWQWGRLDAHSREFRRRDDGASSVQEGNQARFGIWPETVGSGSVTRTCTVPTRTVLPDYRRRRRSAARSSPPSPRRALRCGDRWSSSQEIRHPLLDRPSDHRLRLHISSDRASNAMVAGGVVARYLTRVILDVSLARPLAGIAASARGTPGGWRSRRQIWAGPIIRTRSASLEDQEGVGRNHQLDVAVVGWDGGTQVADVAPS